MEAAGRRKLVGATPPLTAWHDGQQSMVPNEPASSDGVVSSGAPWVVESTLGEPKTWPSAKESGSEGPARSKGMGFGIIQLVPLATK